MNKYCLILMMLLTLSFNTQGVELSNAQQIEECKFSQPANWSRSEFEELPKNVADNPATGEPEFCEFYQFAQEYFLYLISPSMMNSSKANWEDKLQFPILEAPGANSCDDKFVEHSFKVRTAKDPKDAHDAVIPERVVQAGSFPGTIYDQQGNVVFYEVRFSRNLCNVEKIQSKLNFPGKTVELKMAWQILDKQDNNDTYVQVKRTIDGTEYLLGLIGWHIVIAADNHPEFVWATIEHDGSAVRCDDMGKQSSGFSFTSKSCAKDEKCDGLNKTQSYEGIHLPAKTTANDICTVFPYGTVDSTAKDSRDYLNIQLIKKLNNQLQSLFDENDEYAIWKNYRFAGALWVSDIEKDSYDKSNQRGSLVLANTFMETSKMGSIAHPENATNCFGCHIYRGTKSKVSNTSGNTLSHIIDDIALGLQINKVSASGQ